MSKAALLLYGCSGAGKGVFTEGVMKEVVGDIYVSETGKFFRAHPEFSEAAGKGVFVDDHHVMDFWQDEVKDCGGRSIIFDSPRTRNQVVLLAHFLKDQKYDKIAAVYVDTPAHICRKRLIERADKEGRHDDKCEKSIDTRITGFLNESPSTISQLQFCVDPKKSLYFHIIGTQLITDIHRQARVIAEDVFGKVRRHVLPNNRAQQKSKKSGVIFHLPSVRHQRKMRHM